MMKFAIINDLHIGPADVGYEKGVQRKLLAEGTRIMKKIIKVLNEKEKPEFVINLGDSIEDVNDREKDIESFKYFVSLLATLNVSVHTLVGNHDLRTLTVQDIAKILDYKEMYYSFDHNSFHFIALSFEMTGDHTNVLSDITAKVPKKQLLWLTNDLDKTDKPVVVFIHYPLAEDDMKGNFWFETEPQYALLANRVEVRSILESSGKVKAVFSAHQHWNRFHVQNNIPYFVATSPIENFKNQGTVAETYTIVNLDNKGVKVKVVGNDPAEFSYTFNS